MLSFGLSLTNDPPPRLPPQWPRSAHRGRDPGARVAAAGEWAGVLRGGEGGVAGDAGWLRLSWGANREV